MIDTSAQQPTGNARQRKTALKLVQFANTPTESDREMLRRSGMRIVDYVPHNAYLVWEEPSNRRQRAVPSTLNPIVYEGDYLPSMKMEKQPPTTAARSSEVGFYTVVLYDAGQTLQDDIDALVNTTGAFVLDGPNFGLPGPYVAISVAGTAAEAAAIAEFSTVVHVERHGAAETAGESSDLIVANQTKIVGGKEIPEGPVEDGVTYTGWLASNLGFSHTSDDKYPIVVVNDTGVDVGKPGEIDTPDFHVLGNLAAPMRVKFAKRWDNFSNTLTNTNTGSSTGGHGFFVTSMLLGYNTDPGAANEHVPTGFQYGLGGNPYGRSGSIKNDIFPFAIESPDFNSADVVGMVESSWLEGSAANTTGGHPGIMSSNSWIILRPNDNCPDIDDNPNNNFYDVYCSIMDARTRDALPDDIHPESGSNPMAFFFAAGNSGWIFADSDCFPTLETCEPAVPRLNTIFSPAIAKNVITVGGSENVDRFLPIPPDIPCLPYFKPYRSDDANDVAFESSKGVPGVRIKPDILAPSQMVYANGHSPGFVAPDNLVPESSVPRLYSRANGTSFSTPLVAGAAQIMSAHVREEWGITNPSPALMRGYVIHTGEFLRGAHSGPWNGTTYVPHPLPSPYQGFGRVNLERGLDSVSRVLVDQTVVFDDNGDSWSFAATSPDQNKPMRVTLTWTDAPAMPGTQLWHELVNDLDLVVTTVEVGGGIPRIRYYVGNHFSSNPGQEDISSPVTSAQQTSGAFADRHNNVECVFLPATTAAQRFVFVTVRANALNKDALDPDNVSGPARQDFALVTYNVGI